MYLMKGVENSSCCPEVKGCCTKADGAIESVKVLGAGCPGCHKQYENAKAAVSELSFGIEVEYVTDMGKVMTLGVMSMPAIVVNDKVIAMGRILSVEEVKMALDKFI